MTDILAISEEEYIEMVNAAFSVNFKHLNKKQKKACFETAITCNELIYNKKGHFGDDVKARLRTKLENRQMNRQIVC